MNIADLRIVIPSTDCPEPALCGDPECGKPAGTCDCVFCPTHRIWVRDNGGRRVGCPGICPQPATGTETAA